VAEIVCEFDSWPGTLEKVSEYLNLGVACVCTVNTVRQEVSVFRIDGSITLLCATDALKLPELTPGFELSLTKLFG
jgi:Uma2 family endonuclease